MGKLVHNNPQTLHSKIFAANNFEPYLLHKYDQQDIHAGRFISF